MAELSGSHEARKLGCFSIEGRRHPTSHPSVFGSNQTVGKIGSGLLPDKKRFLDGWFVFKLDITHQTLWLLYFGLAVDVKALQILVRHMVDNLSILQSAAGASLN